MAKKAHQSNVKKAAKKSAKPTKSGKKSMKKHQPKENFMLKLLKMKQEKIKEKQAERNNSIHLASSSPSVTPHQEMRYSKFMGPRRRAS